MDSASDETLETLRELMEGDDAVGVRTLLDRATVEDRHWLLGHLSEDDLRYELLHRRSGARRGPRGRRTRRAGGLDPRVHHAGGGRPAFLGGIVPLVLRRFRVDPAVASGPLLTTVTDMCGFFLVLTLAASVLERLG